MDYDVIVAGAGPGGTIAARDLARAGHKVGLFDSEELETMGKSIVVEAERKMFTDVDVRVPSGDEVPYHQKRMRVFSGRGRECFTLEGEHPAMSIRLDEFSRRMAKEAIGAGAEFVGGHKATGPLMEDGAVGGARFSTSDGEKEYRAAITIDATGFAGAIVRGLDPSLGVEFVDRKEDVVLAENYFHDIDVDKAREAVANRVHLDDEVWNRLAGHGNYSTEYSYLSIEKRRAYILLGRKATYDQPPLIDVIDHFREEQGYYGDCLYGGQGPIRVRRALDQLVCPGFMVVGEAACTIINAHGSGVSSALYTGHLAAKTASRVLKEGRDPDTAALWPYSYKYQSGRGAVLATYAAQKLLLDTMKQEEVWALLEDGGMQPEDLFNGAVPKAMSASAKTLPGRALGILKNPGMIGALVKMGKVIASVKKHYENYPPEHDAARVKEWKRRNAEIFEPLDRAAT